MQSIEIDRCRRLVRARHDDGADPPAIVRAYADLREVLRGQFGHDPDFVMLIDASACRSASPDARARLWQEVEALPPSRRTALVGYEAPLSAIHRAGLRAFAAIAPALAWLEGG